MGKNRLPFLQLVYKIVMDCQNDEECGIQWSEDGTAVEIHKEKFRMNTLGKFFKTKLLTSFSRNMNIHGFSKTSCDDIITYWHPDFQIDKPPQVKVMKKEPYRGVKKPCKAVRIWETGLEMEQSLKHSEMPFPGLSMSMYGKYYDSILDGKMVSEKLSHKKRPRQGKMKPDGEFPKRARKGSPEFSYKTDLRGQYYGNGLNMPFPNGKDRLRLGGDHFSHSPFYKYPLYSYGTLPHGYGSKHLMSTFDMKVGGGPLSRPSLDMRKHRSQLAVEPEKLFAPVKFENTVEVSRDNSKTLLEQVLSSEIPQWDNPNFLPSSTPETIDFLPSTPETIPMVHRVSSPISIFEAATAAAHYHRA